MDSVTARSALGVGLIVVSFATAAEGATDAFPVSIRVDASQSLGPLRPIWRFFGADEPNYATMPHGRKLLGELGKLAGGTDNPVHANDGQDCPSHAVYFRAHNLLTTGDGTPALKWGSTNAYREDDAGNPVYDWTILDGIFDAYRENRVRPLVEIGFMPRDLSTRPEPYRHRWGATDPYAEIFTGWAHPPDDYGRWAELVHRWAAHCVERYGADEVATWYWETWNEPNIPYWQGTQEEFIKLHDYAIDAVRRALPTARVGGPHTAGGGGQFLRDFLEHCLRGKNYATGQVGTPLDFIAFHAKGAPQFVDGHVRIGIAEQLRTIDGAFAIVGEFPELKQTPIIIGESDPEGCAACQGPQLAYRNGTMYSSYTAASFARKHDLAARHGVNLEGALTWAFEFEGQPFFAGFRALATNGIDKPVLNVFRMFAKMQGERVAVESDSAVALESILRDGVRDRPDVSALASRDGSKLYVMLWHYHDDDLPGPAAEVTLTLDGLTSGGDAAGVEYFTIDAEHSNAYTAWQRMGSPQNPTADQYAELERAGRLGSGGPIAPVPIQDDRATIHLNLPRQAVSLLAIDFGKRE